MAHPQVLTALGVNNHALPAHPAPTAANCTRLALEAETGDAHVVAVTTTLVLLKATADTYFLVGGEDDISETGFLLDAGVAFSFSVTPGASLGFYSADASDVTIVEG